MSAGHSWFDLSAVPAGPAKRRAKGLVVTVRGVEWYEPSRVVRNRSGTVTEVTVVESDSKRTYALVDRAVRSVASVRSKRSPKVVREEVREVAAPVMTVVSDTAVKGEIAAAPAIDAGSLARNVDTSWNEQGKGGRPLASYAQRKAAVIAARGW